MATPPNDLNLTVTVGQADVLNLQPKAKLRALTEIYAAEVFVEASRYEAAQRTPHSNVPEFTTTHVVDADVAVRRRGSTTRSPKSRKLQLVMRLIFYLAAIATGVGGNNLDKTWGLVVFVASLVAGLLIVAVFEIMEGSSGAQ